MVFHVTIHKKGDDKVTDLGDYSIDALRSMVPQWASLLLKSPGDKIVLERVF